MNETNYKGVDLNLLLVFAVVMQEGSTTTAAQRLCISQSAVSQSLRRLRLITNDKLFIRDRRGVTPTVRAVTLYRELLPSLDAIENALQRKEPFDPDHSNRTFRIRCLSILGTTIIPHVLKHIEMLCPNVRVEITVQDVAHADETNSGGTLASLDRDEFDVVIGSPDYVLMRSRHRNSVIVPVSLACIYDGPRLGLGSPITLKQYVDTKHVVPTFVLHMKSPIDDALEGIGLKRDRKISTNDFSAIPLYLKNLAAIANFPTRVAGLLAKEFDLTLSPLPFKCEKFRYAMFWHGKNDDDAGHRWLRDAITSCLSALSESEPLDVAHKRVNS